METKTKVYLAKQAAMLCASLLIVLLSAYVEGHGQNIQSGTQNIVLSIQGSGTIIVSGYPNPIVGPVNNSLIGPFASGSLLSLTAHPADGWSFIGWVGPVLELPEANPNTLIILDDDVHLTAIFRRIITLSEFQADDKVYNGTTLASVSSWGNLQGVMPGDEVQLVTTAYNATFDTKATGSNKTVTITGLTLEGAASNDYQIASPVVAHADILPATLTVSGASAHNKIFDGTNTATVNWTGATLTGMIAPDVVTLVTTGYTATFNNANIGVGKPVTVAGLTLTGADAGNYTLTQPALTADLTAKPITVTATVADKVYDGTTDATVTNWVVTGTIAGYPTDLNTTGYVANFIDPNVGNSKLVSITNVTPVNTNYSLNIPINESGNIVAPYFAMFTPYYDVVGTRPTASVANVPVDTPISIEFNKSVVDINGDVLPMNDLGDFVKLEWWNAGGTSWDLVPFTAARVGNKITFTVLAGDLEYDELYRLRFLNIYKPAYAGAGQVEYTLDGGDRDPEIVGSLQLDNIVEFTTMSVAAATLPTVTPYGEDFAFCGEVIKLTFENPVEYLNGNQITDNAKHKFTLQSSVDNVSWTDVYAADWYVAINVFGNPTEFTFTYIPLYFSFNKYFRIKNNIGLDLNYGFVDKVTGLTLLSNEISYDHTQGNDGWWWQTASEYSVKAFVNYTTINTEFGSRPNNLNNVSFDGNNVISYGIAPAFPLTINNDFVADGTLTYPLTATAGEGYHFSGWRRSTNGGIAYGNLLPLTGSGIIGIDIAPQNFIFDADQLKPTNCSQSIAYRADFDINKYNIVTTVNGSGIVTPTNASLTNLNHGTTVSLTATPAPGYRFVGWNFEGLPGTVTTSIPDHNAIGYPTTGADGSLTFELIGDFLTHGQTFNVQANFAAWEPKVFMATDPQNAFTGLINATVQFGYPARTGFGQEEAPFTGLDFDWESFVYNTPLKLEALGADCRYEFVKWQKWNPAILPAGGWVDYPQPQETAFVNITENLRFKAVSKLLDDVHISATPTNMGSGTVIIYADAARTIPIAINDPAGADFTYGDVLYMTIFHDPDAYTWAWTDFNGFPAEVTLAHRFEDRSLWEYTAGCQSIDLKAVIEPIEHQAIVCSLNSLEGTIDASLPGFDASTGNQGGLGFTFTNDGAGIKGQGFFQRNGSLAFAATANADFAFTHWETPGGVVLEGNPFVIPSIQGDVELIAVFESTLNPSETYSLNTNSSPASSGTTHPASGAYEENQSVTITATAAPGYNFSNWSADGISLTPEQTVSNPLVIEMPSNAVSLTANNELATYTVTPVCRTYLRPHSSFTVVDWGGTVSKTPASGTFTAGQTLALSATPLPGFRFINWMEGEILPGEILRGIQLSDQQNFEYTVPFDYQTNRFIYAIFLEIALPEFPVYTLETAASPDGFGMVTGAANFAHSIQAIVSEQVSQPGFAFSNWSENVVTTEDLSYVHMVNGDETAIAHYDELTYQLNVVSGNPSYGSTTQTANQFTVSSTPITISAQVAPPDCEASYAFEAWFSDPGLSQILLDAGGNPIVSPEFMFMPYALPYGQTELYLFAKFTAQPNTYVLNAFTALNNPGNPFPEAGIVTISDAGPYYCGSTVSLATIPNDGYSFLYWADASGNILSDQSTYIHSFDAAITIAAVYQLTPYNLTILSQPGGIVTPGSGQHTNGQSIVLTATADEGFVFTGWESSDVVITDIYINPLSFTMPGHDVSITAMFTAICSPIVITGPDIVCYPPYTASYQTSGPAGGVWSVDQPDLVLLSPQPDGNTIAIEFLDAGIVQLTYTQPQCVGEASATVAITVMETADAGPDQIVCGALTTQLSANQPLAGGGFWSQVDGPGILSFSPDLTDPLASIQATHYGTYVLAWVQETCNSTDQVSIRFREALNLSPSLSIEPETICEGIPATITVNPNYGGNVLDYNWFVNEQSIGINTPVYTNFFDLNTSIRVEITVENQCGDQFSFSTPLLSDFVQGVYLSVQTSPIGAGSIGYTGIPAIGSVITFSAEANTDWQLDYWMDGNGNILGYEPELIDTIHSCSTYLTAYFTQACRPDWSVQHNYEYNMQLIGQLHFQDGVGTHPNHWIGAFVGDECRGITRPMASADGKFFLSISSNTESGETIDFRLWNANQCQECFASQYFTFNNLAEIGTIDAPFELSCGARLEIDFPAGFKWFSTNIQQQSMELNHVFSDLSPSYNDRLIGQSSFSLFTGENWLGSLQLLDFDAMYKLRLQEAQTNRFRGSAASIDPVPLNSGFTWLGYLPQECLPIQQALADLHPAPSYNDRLISQSAFAVFTGSSWIGSLTQLCPGDGFILRLANSSTLNWPSSNVPAIADFSADPLSGTAPLTVQFTDQSINNPTEWLWDFGDGQTSTEQNPSHTYQNPGSYTVQLTVSKSLTGSSTATKADYIIAAGTTLWPPGTVHCNGTPTAIADVTNPITGKTWMDRNLGAARAATSSTDSLAYGDLYQWGRFADGHQCRNSAVTSTLSSTDAPGHGDYILALNSPYDWRSPQNDHLWQGNDGVNNPCPIGFRLPTDAELLTEITSWSSNNSTGAYNSTLKLLTAGFRADASGVPSAEGQLGVYWSSNQNFTEAGNMFFYDTQAGVGTYARAIGASIRCIKDTPEPTSYNLHLEVNPANTGSATGAGAYQSGTTVSITATPDQGWEFVSWTGDVAYLDNPDLATATFTMPAENAALTANFEQNSFACGDSFIDPRDGNGYTTVLIGDQCWMKENLNVGMMIHSSQFQSDNNVIEKYCFNNESANCEEFGGLYQWDEMMQYISTPGTQGLCPENWVVPTNDDWVTLSQALGGGDIAGGKMKSTGTEFWVSPNIGATNSSGFSGLPAGMVNASGGFQNFGYNALIRSSTNRPESNDAFFALLQNDNENLHISSAYRMNGFSVRCIKVTETLIGIINSLDCNISTTIDTLTQGNYINGIIINVSYTGGNGGVHNGQMATSTGVSGLTAILTAGSFAVDNGSLPYIISGTPESSGIAYFALNIGGQSCILQITINPSAGDLWPPGTIHCNGIPTEIVDVTNPITGRTWMDRNLGASQAATSSTDELAYGDLYQWGRFADGHQCRNSNVTTTLSNSLQPNHSFFIINGGDWLLTPSSNLWQGYNGINNPCPVGYRLPKNSEWDTERQTWITNTSEGGYASPLKLTKAQLRNGMGGGIIGVVGEYWSSSTYGSNSGSLYLEEDNSYVFNNFRINGLTVRCIKD